MGRSLVETLMGAVVLAVAGWFLIFAYTTADIRPVAGYRVLANFNKIGSLEKGSDVRIAGIKVGTVTDTRLDPKTFQAVVEMSVQSAVRLPVDTQVSIASEGLLGGKYIKLDPGQDSKTVAANETLKQTKDVVALEDLIGEIIFLATESPDKANNGKK